MLISVATALGLVSFCIFLHFHVLRLLSRTVLHRAHTIKRPLLKVTFALFALHFVEVLLYALAMVLMDAAQLGSLGGATAAESREMLDYFYFSMASYTTLGLGDIVPHGAVRLVAAFEALNGLVLVAWSASFTYLMMESFWTAGLDAEGGD